MIAFETMGPNMKIKIRLPPKKIEADSDCGTRKVELRGCNPKKRGPHDQDSIEGQKEIKRQKKMDRRVSLQCAAIIKSLTTHRYSWVFNKPVDPVALNIPDYFTVITRPMDLGTIKSKLEKNIYFDIHEFAADVRLTFSNAMTYNPPSNDVHIMAKVLSKLFETKWKEVEKKCKCEVEHGKSNGKSMSETVRNITETISCNAPPLQKHTFPQKSQQVPELKGIQMMSSLVGTGRLAKEELPKLSQIPARRFTGKDLRKGDRRHPSGPGKSCPSICGDIVSDSDQKEGSTCSAASYGDVQLSLKPALHAAKKRLERLQRDEKAKVEAQIKAAEVKAEKDKQGRYKEEREAARIAILNMERRVKIENNFEIVKELEMLSGGKLYYPGLSSTLKRLGLFMKDEYILDEDEIEEGEIIS